VTGPGGISLSTLAPSITCDSRQSEELRVGSFRCFGYTGQMLRVLLIVWLALAAPLQSLGLGEDSTRVENAASGSVQLVQSDHIPTVAEAKSHCCEEAKLAQDRAAPCSSDCKAVMAMTEAPSTSILLDQGALYRAPDKSLHRTVDLRPPIS
jgi:hypothetical protein